MAHGYPYGFLAIDNFTKYLWVVPIESKTAPEFIRAMEEVIKAMGKPKKIYSDRETAMEKSYEFPIWLAENKILHITTRGHASTAERAMRTFKDMLTRRVESAKIEPGEVWYGQIRLSILMKFNQQMENRTTGLTPSEATKRKMKNRSELCYN